MIYLTDNQRLKDKGREKVKIFRERFGDKAKVCTFAVPIHALKSAETGEFIERLRAREKKIKIFSQSVAGVKKPCNFAAPIDDKKSVNGKKRSSLNYWSNINKISSNALSCE